MLYYGQSIYHLPYEFSTQEDYQVAQAQARLREEVYGIKPQSRQEEQKQNGKYR